ncbi:MAG: DUF2782 domain-containing protein [Propionivibrio sp.]
MPRLTAFFALLAVLIIGAAPGLAQPTATTEPVPPLAPAPVPEPQTSGAVPLDDSLEPQVTIERREGSTVEEFRVNGKLYKIRVTPDNGPPYYLIDLRGDGTFTRMDTPGTPQLSVPMWVIGTF